MSGSFNPFLHGRGQFLLSGGIEQLLFADEQLHGPKFLQQATAAASNAAAGSLRPPDEFEGQKTFEGFDDDGSGGDRLVQHRVVVVELLVF